MTSPADKTCRRSQSSFNLESLIPPFDTAESLLPEVGNLVELDNLIWFRRQSILEMVKVLSVRDLLSTTFTAVLLVENVLNNAFMEALVAFSWEIGRRIYLLFQHILFESQQAPMADKERILIKKRLIDSTQTYMNNRVGDLVHDVPEDFESAFMSVRDELVKYYEDRHDQAEADRILSQHTRTQRYEIPYPHNRLQNHSQRIAVAAGQILKMVSRPHQMVLGADMPAQITPAHLSLLSGRNGGTFWPHDHSLMTQRDFTGRNTCQLAAELGDIEFLRRFLDQDRQLFKQAIKERDRFGLTALLITAIKGDRNAFIFLAENGANLWEARPNGRDSLCLASLAGHTDIVEYVVPKMQSNYAYLWSPLHDACIGNHLRVVKALLPYYPDLQILHPNYPGFTALEVAKNHGHHDLAQYLETQQMHRLQRAQLAQANTNSANAQARKRKDVHSTPGNATTLASIPAVSSPAINSRPPSRNKRQRSGQQPQGSTTNRECRHVTTNDQPTSMDEEGDQPVSRAEDEPWVDENWLNEATHNLDMPCTPFDLVG